VNLPKQDDDLNSIVDIKQYLSSPEQPLTMAEFKEFWDSCTEKEKDEFRKMELPK
jgi:hypothetical protein